MPEMPYPQLPLCRSILCRTNPFTLTEMTKKEVKCDHPVVKFIGNPRTKLAPVVCKKCATILKGLHFGGQPKEAEKCSCETCSPGTLKKDCQCFPMSCQDCLKIRTTMKQDKRVKNRIIEYLLREGRSQKELAKYCGVTPQMVNMWCSNKYNPNAENSAKIVDFFGGLITIKTIKGKFTVKDLFYLS